MGLELYGSGTLWVRNFMHLELCGPELYGSGNYGSGTFWVRNFMGPELYATIPKFTVVDTMELL